MLDASLNVFSSIILKMAGLVRVSFRYSLLRIVYLKDTNKGVIMTTTVSMRKSGRVRRTLRMLRIVFINISISDVVLRRI